MNFEQQLSHAADRYRAQGYDVIVRPQKNELPDFARNFKIEILAKRGDASVLVSAKKNQSELESDRDIAHYAERTEDHAGWRFDLIVLESQAAPLPATGGAREPSEEDTRRALDDVGRLMTTGFLQQALIAAWAVLEPAMRSKLRAIGEAAGQDLSPQTMLNELYSAGVLERSVFRDLEGLYKLRNAIVHGFVPPTIESSAVRLLIDVSRSLMDESKAVKKIA